MVKRRKGGRKGKDSPSEKRFKEKDGEVAIARGRLAGALKGILNSNAEDSDELDSPCHFNSATNSANKKLRDPSSSLWKKMGKGNDAEDHHSFFMKLFDRSVDLAQFDIDTSLYPICRAWIQNKPFLSTRKREDGNGLVEIKHEVEEIESQLFELHEKQASSSKGEDVDVHSLPAPKPLPEGVTSLRVPSPIKTEIQEINISSSDSDQAPTKEELLQSHLKNWGQVRKRWRIAGFKNEERYSTSKEILTKMFERAQVQFGVS